MEKLYNPHDRFFKEVLGDVANTQAFLEIYLHSEETVSTLISTDTPFGIPTNPQSSKKNPITVYPTEGKGHETKLIYLEKMERKIAFIDRSKIT